MKHQNPPTLHLKTDNRLFYPLTPRYNMGDNFVRCFMGKKRSKEFHFTQLVMSDKSSVKDFILTLPSIERVREQLLLDAEYFYGDKNKYDRMVKDFNTKWKTNNRTSKQLDRLLNRFKIEEPIRHK